MKTPLKRIARRCITSTVLLGAALMATACAPRSHTNVPEEDLTPYQRLVRTWTGRYFFRRSVGGDDLVSERDAVVQRPVHEQRILIEAILYADTLVQAELLQLADVDTLRIDPDSLNVIYNRAHSWPEHFRIYVQAVATLDEPFRLEPLTIFLKDQNDVDYEPARASFTPPVLSQRSYLDTEVRRYDPYTSSEYQVYSYRQGQEYESRGTATLYFARRNVMGTDLLSTPGAELTLIFQRDRRKVGEITWNLDEIRSMLAASQETAEDTAPPAVEEESDEEPGSPEF